jgi:energy-converting hydrogenase A subunit M
MRLSLLHPRIESARADCLMPAEHAVLKSLLSNYDDKKSKQEEEEIQK